MKNIRIDARSARDIDSHIDRVHRDLGYQDGKVQLPEVRDLLRLDLRYYRLDDPGLQDEIIHKLKVGAKQVIKRPKLLFEAVRKFDLNALFMPDQKRIYIDDSIPDLKKRWCESHEVAHSLIPWHSDYMLGDDRATLSPTCHQTIEAEANYGSGRLIFPHKVFSEARLSSQMDLAHIRSLANHFGNTITSTLWRCVEQSDEVSFAAIGEHPHHIREARPLIEYFICSKSFEQQFSNITEADIWAWIRSFCRATPTGPLGFSETKVADVNGEPYFFLIESFSIKHSVLTLGRCLRKAPIQVGG